MSDFDKVIACFRELKSINKFNVDYFDNRIIIQKIIFLLKMKGVNFESYKFDFYIRGPYCSQLTKDMYERKLDFQNLDSDYPLSDKEQGVICGLIDNIPLKPDSLEIAATYVYLTKIEGLNDNDAIKKVKQVKSFYSDNQIINTIYKLKGFVD